MKKHVLLLVALATFFTAFISCSSDDTPQMSKVAVRLVDAPGDYDEVNIDVQDVMIGKALETLLHKYTTYLR